MHELRRVFVAKGRLGDIITLPGQLRNGQRLTAMGKGGRGINKHRHQLASMPARTSGADGHTLSACLSVCLFPNSIYTWGSNLFPVGVGVKFGAPKWPLPGGCPAVARPVARRLPGLLPGWLPGGCCWGLCWVNDLADWRSLSNTNDRPKYGMMNTFNLLPVYFTTLPLIR